MHIAQLFRKKSVNQILKEINAADHDHKKDSRLRRTLKARDLTFFGIAAIVGAGIFGTIGQASFDGGPAVSLLFVFIAIACGFSALCYAEFASMIPISGSAYTYSYAVFGELIAWIIGWDLLMEYAIGNIVVAQNWSAYFQTFIGGFNLHLPAYLTCDIVSAYHSFEAGHAAERGYIAWTTAPRLGLLPLIADVPALSLIIFMTSLIYIGIKESRTAANVMVILKIGAVVAVILIGIFYVDPGNWSPFLPNGVSGLLKGVAAVFFAYIGFDAISTTAEECENPQRDLPKGMITSLIICTILFVAISLVLTGMMTYTKLNVKDPLAFVFTQIPSLQWVSGIISLSAIIATASVFLVFQLGQPRIWMSMSRDGLLPRRFSMIHPIHKTPGFATVVTGFFTAIPVLFLNFSVVLSLTSIGTLFAFTLVCAGVLVMHGDRHSPSEESLKPDGSNRFPGGKFRVPYVNAKWIFPIIFIVGWTAMLIWNVGAIKNLFSSTKQKTATQLFESLNSAQKEDLEARLQIADSTENKIGLKSYLTSLTSDGYEKFLLTSQLEQELIYLPKWRAFVENLPYWIFVIYSFVMAIYSFRKNLSLLPLIGLTMCIYLMSALTVDNWLRFSIWLVVGLTIYFLYGYRNSKLNREKSVAL